MSIVKTLKDINELFTYRLLLKSQEAIALVSSSHQSELLARLKEGFLQQINQEIELFSNIEKTLKDILSVKSCQSYLLQSPEVSAELQEFLSMLRSYLEFLEGYSRFLSSENSNIEEA